MQVNRLPDDMVEIVVYQTAIKLPLDEAQELHKLLTPMIYNELYSYKITTGMGRVGSHKDLPFLTKDQVDEFNDIGYTGRNKKGIKTNYQEYLNSLNIGTFSVTRTRADSGDFIEEFLITYYL